MTHHPTATEGHTLNIRILPFALLLGFAASACSQHDSLRSEAPQPPSAADQTMPVEMSCDAAKASAAIGQIATAEIQEQARTAAGADSVRTIGPDEMTTREFVEARLNLHVDDDNQVTSATCG
jgi:hypothetical protein